MTARDTIRRAVSSGRRTLRQTTAALRRSGAPANGAAPARSGPAGAELVVGPSELRARRDALARRLAELQWDLGGLAYEMAIRDHYRLDVLTRAASVLQGVDSELAEAERLLRLDDAGAAGSCPSCGALHARGALFCSQCGVTLMATQPAP